METTILLKIILSIAPGKELLTSTHLGNEARGRYISVLSQVLRSAEE